jgi:ribulose-bisphosphate carboxylase large chain
MRFSVTFHVRSDAAGIEARAQGIAVEQSVEMPLEGIDDRAVLDDVVGQVEAIDDLGAGWFAVRIGLAAATVGRDAGQLLNMLFGNTSLHPDVVLHDMAIPDGMARAFGGPRHGIKALRQRLGVTARAFTGSALKPQGLPPERLARLAEQFARGGLDFIKDDHGLADQVYSPFAERVRACAAAVSRGVRATGHPTRYIPSLTGDLDQLRAQARIARAEGLDCVMIAPMIAGFPAFQAIVREFPDLAVFAHPSLGGLRVSPELLIGALFPLIGADAVIFPSHGGRFGYSPDTCRTLAERARGAAPGLRPALPVPAGGMTLARTGEILDFYGPDTMLLIGGNLLLAREQITRDAARFARAVSDHRYAEI